MANLDRIVNVTIQLNTTGVKVSSFSDMLILAPHNLSAARVTAITSVNDLIDLGLSSESKLYKAASAVFSQTDHVAKCYIGRLAADSVPVRVSRLVRGDYTIAIGNDSATHTATAKDTTKTIATKLATKMKGWAGISGATVSGDTITIATESPIKLAGKLAMDDSVTKESAADALAACDNEGFDWYGLIATTRDPKTVLDIAAWTEANEKLFGTASAEPAIADGANSGDIASLLKEKNYYRSYGVYHTKAANEYAEAGLMSLAFTQYPGHGTWALRKLAGLSSDALTETQSEAARNKNFSTFESFGSFSVTQQGKVAAGEWIDIIRFRDWLANTMQADVVFAMINADGKVPYTDEGIQVLYNAMLPSLDLGVLRGGIAPPELDEDKKVIPSYVIDKPRAAKISDNKKASRILDDMTFTARVAGAIHVVNIKGNLAYSI